MSSNYLGIKTLELAGVTLNSYQQFVAENYRKYPSVSVLQIRDADGNVYSVDKKEELLNDYQSMFQIRLSDKSAIIEQSTDDTLYDIVLSASFPS